jgi:amino acid transporter/mannitol/fructose-specific phosphotransferase system IIA component (Ntr-type)
VSSVSSSQESGSSKSNDQESGEKLEKKLGLFDVFAVATGAMFSSGFFLLPGIAAAQTGPSVVLAYLISGLLVLPATLSAAELSTAMPRAGGAYFFLDRTLGPLMGTIGGIGTWVALVLKSAFALVGIGAYLAIFVDLPIKPVALGLIVAFTVLNLFGTKETSGLQRILVAVLLAVLTYFLFQGVWTVSKLPTKTISEQFSPMFLFGLSGLFSTVGLVFVSYAGLTKVASIAEEVKNPDRNVPLGMFLALGCTLVVYVVGVFVMVAVLDPGEFQKDLTPVATAGEAFFAWLPEPTGLILVVTAAIAAFASTGNAGLMSASRYPLAMARDQLVPSYFAKISRFKTPTLGVLITSAAMSIAILLLDVAALAKLASAIQLILFGLLCFAIIIMRESELEYYHPGFKSPLYPWTQIAGMIIPVWLIIEMGWMSVLFTAGVAVVALLWFIFYARRRVDRGGALLHLFRRLGNRADKGLHHELRQVVAEKGLIEEDAFEEMITSATVIDIHESVSFHQVINRAAVALAEKTPVTEQTLIARFEEELEIGLMPVASGAAVPHLRVSELEDFHVALVRIRKGTPLPDEAEAWSNERIYAVLCLVGPERVGPERVGPKHPGLKQADRQQKAGAHLRLLAQLASSIDHPDFLEAWLDAGDEAALKTILMRSEHFHEVEVEARGSSHRWLGQHVRDLDLPEGTLIAMVRREGTTRAPTANTVIDRGDHLVFIGSADAIEELREQLQR